MNQSAHSASGSAEKAASEMNKKPVPAGSKPGSVPGSAPASKPGSASPSGQSAPKQTNKHYLRFNFARWLVLLVVIVPVALIWIISMAVYTRRELSEGVENVRQQLTAQTLNRANEVRNGIDTMISEVDTIRVLLSGPRSFAGDYIDNTIEKLPNVHAVVVSYDSRFLAEIKRGEHAEYRLENHFGLLEKEEVPEHYSPVVYRDFQGNVCREDIGSDQDELQDWYLLAKYLNRGCWSDPFVSRLMLMMVCTYSAPFYYEGKIAGVVCVAFDASKMFGEELALELGSVGASGMFLLADNGKILFHTNQDRWRRVGIYTMVPPERREEIYPLLDQMLSNTIGSIRLRDWGTFFPGYVGGENVWFVYAPIQNGTDWTLVATFDEAQTLADLRHKLLFNWLGGAASLGVLVLILVVITLTIYNPIISMSRVAEQVADGDLTARVPEQYTRRHTEVGTLAKNFNLMVANLGNLMEKSTSEKTQIAVYERELNISRQIQSSIMPDQKSLGDRTGFFFDAFIRPARFVAGDFYDFWRIDDDNIALLVADVSGKGVPSAMIMVAVRTIIRQVAQAKTDPSEILFEANQLCRQSNKKFMFVTLILSVYNTRTGELQFSNAGHLPPVFLSHDKSVRQLSGVKNTILGVFPNAEYKSVTFKLEPGDAVFLYTDGVTDTTSPDGTLFATQRMLKTLGEIADRPSEEFIPTMVDRLDVFCNRHQKDDITIVFLKRTE